MCGICGIIDFLGQKPGEELHGHVSNMVDNLHHRGPDFNGTYNNGPIHMGSTRLAIIDRTSAANQPMVSQDDNYIIVFNGEIYNYIELRKKLERKGIFCKTKSDTEVLLNLFIQKGEKCLHDLRGMFAFAVWNKAEQTLFVARDRMGEKPFVYHYENGLFSFASEIKALLQLPWIDKKINFPALHYGLHFATVPAPYSAFKGIHKLPPSTQMTITSQEIGTKRYWQPRYNENDFFKDPRECVEAINQCLDETVRIICRSDAPIGAMLSGGLDSSAIVASIAQGDQAIDTFCISNRNLGGADEFAAASLVAKHCGTRHHELVFPQDNFSTFINEIVKSYNEPVASFGPLQTHALSGFIKKHVTVALTGNGGDELFGGYNEHRNLFEYDRSGGFELDHVGERITKIPTALEQKIFNNYGGLTEIERKRYGYAAIHFAPISSFCEKVYGKRLREISRDHDPLRLFVGQHEKYGAPGMFDGALFQQLMQGSQHALVDFPDISGMAHSMEYRSPFLDVRMVELGMRIPADMKIRQELQDSGGKWILRKALENRLPKEIVQMRKVGFGTTIPYKKWFFTDWFKFLEKKLSNPLLEDFELFKTNELGDMLFNGARGGLLLLEQLWGVAMISMWLENNIVD
ncbi:MAG: asparagine synthase (glutamine-hydrolyzing) [Pseudomonadota bacterium]